MNLVNSNRIIFVLSLAGAGVSTYLTLAHLNFVDIGCSAVHGCEEVARHYTAKGFGIPGLQWIPTAAFGVIMYAALAALSMTRASNPYSIASIKAARKQLILSTLGVLGTIYLTYLEAFVIHAWCQWCLASAFIISSIFLTCLTERVIGRPPIEGASV